MTDIQHGHLGVVLSKGADETIRLLTALAPEANWWGFVSSFSRAPMGRHIANGVTRSRVTVRTFEKRLRSLHEAISHIKKVVSSPNKRVEIYNLLLEETVHSLRARK